MASSRSRRRAFTYGIVALAIVSTLYAMGGLFSGLRSISNAVVKPFSWTIDAIARPVGNFLAGAVDYNEVVAQNRQLQKELADAQLRANEAWGSSRIVGEIGSTLNLHFAVSTPLVAAQIIERSPSNFSASFELNRGLRDGVQVGMPVVGNGGLVGRVIAVTATTATVREITDPASAIGVTFGKGTTSMIVSGAGVNNGLQASSIPLSSNLQPGQVVTTDGLAGGLYPSGIPVATVLKLTLSARSADYAVSLNPTAQLTTLTYVDVMLWEPST